MQNPGPFGASIWLPTDQQPLHGDAFPGDPTETADGDGMGNNFVTAYGFNPNNPDDAALDSDGDGASNLVEF